MSTDVGSTDLGSTDLGSTDLGRRAARLDTASISDAMDSLGLTGALPGIRARVDGARVAGPAWTVTYGPIGGGGGFRNAGNYLDDVPPGAVVVVDNGGSDRCTNWGSLLTTVAQLRGVAGTVIHGSARDLAEIRERRYPLFSTGVHMVSGKNRVELAAIGRPVQVEDVVVTPGDLVVADDNGVISVPADRVAEVVARAERVESTERAIAEAVLEGMPLTAARERFGYARPWEGISA